jgi:dihydroflavonol-4-reductase
MILLTGSTGLLGSQLLFDLTSQGHEVKALRKKDSDLHVAERLFKNHKEQFQLVKWITGDVTDLFSLQDAMENVTSIYHCAAMISFHPSDQKQMHKINVEGTANMINFALENNIQRFCHVSSVAALGRSAGEKPIDENNLWKTSGYNSYYAISKYGGEREVWRGIEEGLNAFIINPSIIIGPGNWTSGSTQLFNSIYKGLPFYSAGVTGFVDVRDVSRTAIELMERNITAQRFIISSENLSYRELFFMIADGLHKKRPSIEAKPWMTKLVWPVSGLMHLLTGKKPMITKETSKNGMEKWYYNNSKIKTALNFQFIPIAESVKDTCKVFLHENSKK